MEVIFGVVNDVPQDLQPLPGSLSLFPQFDQEFFDGRFVGRKRLVASDPMKRTKPLQPVSLPIPLLIGTSV